jgi:AsmA protein
MTRKLLLGAAGAIVLLLLVGVGAAMLVDVDQFRPALEREFASTVGRKVNLGRITLALMSGSVAVDDVTIAEDPKFGGTPFVTAKAVKVGVDVWPLIASRTLRVRSFTLEQPSITLRRSSGGDWNFSTVGAQTTTPASPSTKSQGPPSSVSIGKLAIAGGRVTVVSPGARGRERVYTDVNLEATELSYTSSFPFRLDAKTPGGGTLHMDGKAGPLNPDDASATPLEARVQIKQLDIAATGFVDPASGLGGIVDFTGTLTSNGREAKSQGTLSASKLKLVQGSSPSGVPMTVDYQSSYDLKRRSGTIDRGNVGIGRARATLTGNFKTVEDTTSVRMKLAGHQMPVPELEASLPALGVTLPSGASLDGGTLDLDLDVNGPVDHLVTTGPIKMSDTQIKGFDLGSKLGAIGALAGLPNVGNTKIQTLASTVRVAPDGIRVDALDLIVPSIGRLTGSGTVAPQGALDFKMVAQLAATTGVVGTVSRMTSLGHPEQGTPFLVRGTTSNPTFAPDVGATVRGVVNQENATKAATGLLKGIFGKKPK